MGNDGGCRDCGFCLAGVRLVVCAGKWGCRFESGDTREPGVVYTVTTLEDGSVVYLAQESTLQYPEHFATDKRMVNLQGEAFFDVAKSRQQAFLIETEKVRIEVLGTAFNVRSHEDGPFKLSVQRGKVKVSMKQGGQSVFVNAGETVTLQAQQLQLSETTDFDAFGRYTRNIRFKDECLEDVLRVVSGSFCLADKGRFVSFRKTEADYRI